MDFDENAHRFQVVPQSPQLGVEFGPRRFFTSLTTGLPAASIEAALAAANGAFNSFLVFPALSFLAECVALVPSAAAAGFPNRFEFGFVQGISWSDVHLEYWGKAKGLGRTIVHISMPNTFEVDTESSIQPWTRAAASRARITRAGQAGTRTKFKVTADFADHPMLMFPHTLRNETGSREHLLRSIQFTIDLRTIFCFRNRADGVFTPISATGWRVAYNHVITYGGGGTTRAIDNRIGLPQFPRGGSPSDVSSTDRNILAMAKAGSPFLTPPVLIARLNDLNKTTVTEETPNVDFDSTFFR